MSILRVAIWAVPATVALSMSGQAEALECGDVVTAATSLVEDLVCDTDPALTVDGGRLDLGQHAVVCRGTSLGIVLEGEGARLRNGAVAGCQVAVLVTGNGRHVVSNVAASVVDRAPDDDSVNAEGMRVESDRNRLLFNRVLLGGRDAIRVNGDRNHIVGNVLGNAERGIRIDGTLNRIDLNVIGGVAEGIEVRGERNRIRRNEIAGAVDQGIELRGGDNEVIGNRASDAEGDGISVFSNNNVVRSNSVYSNGDDGIIVIEGNGGNDLSGNRALGNLQDLTDQNAGCGDNIWTGNTFEVADPADCID